MIREDRHPHRPVCQPPPSSHYRLLPSATLTNPPTAPGNPQKPIFHTPPPSANLPLPSATLTQDAKTAMTPFFTHCTRNLDWPWPEVAFQCFESRRFELLRRWTYRCMLRQVYCTGDSVKGNCVCWDWMHCRKSSADIDIRKGTRILPHIRIASPIFCSSRTLSALELSEVQTNSELQRISK